MKIEDQVVSLELAKKLKELGVKQKSLFTWIKDFHTNNEWKVGTAVDIGNNQDAISRRLEPWYTVGPSAFTVAELGEMLPDKIGGPRSRKYLQLFKDNPAKMWTVHYTNFKTSITEPDSAFCEETEADARCQMLIYLIENKLI